MEFSFLKDILIIFAVSVAVILLFNRLRIPSILGFLITGLLIGPNGFQLIDNIHDVEVLAEIGVILLLFTIGIEFSLGNLIRIGKSILISGTFQVMSTIAVIAFIAYHFGNVVNEAVFIGFLIALSSTAIVLKIIQEKGEIYSAHGRTSLAILIFQDIIVVPMILITPILAGSGQTGGEQIIYLILKFVGILILIMVGSKYIIPLLLFQITRTQSRELFILSTITIAFAVAFLTYSIGLSLALGAFLAGLMISESKYSQHALGNIVPFLDVFTSFFFVSIGMLLNLNTILEDPVRVLLFTTIVLTVKTILAGSASFILGYPLRTSIIVGFTISQVGEFSFILSRIGIQNGLLNDGNYQLFLSVSVLSMAATPFLIRLAPKIADNITKLPLPEKLINGLYPKPESTIGKIQDHLIIVGYGINGKNVARAAKYAEIPHVIIEMNPETVQKEFDKGEIIYFGDAAQPSVLEHVNIHEAMVLVVTIPNFSDTRRIISTAREMNSNIHIIIRTRFIEDVETLFKLGANEVIPEEFETSVEIFTRVLTRYLVPHDKIEKLVAEIRSDGYEMFRKLSIYEDNTHFLQVKIPDSKKVSEENNTN
ncbi:MAG: cation:proton antiporter [Bacteroidetes bacterium]|nr:cation:proton antiporter [Bacteroidota bacterium]